MNTTAHTATAPRKTKNPTINWMLAVFNLPLGHGQLPLFREAVLRCIESPAERGLWAGETQDKDGGTLYTGAYPLLQYRVYHGHAAIYALQAGAPLLQKFVEQLSNTRHPMPFLWKNRQINLHTVEMQQEKGFILKAFSPKLRLQPLVYRLHSWLPLNDENYQWWKENRNLPDAKKTEKLESILINHICACITAAGGYIPKAKIKLSILDKDRLKKVLFKDIGQVAYDLRYTVNLELPPFIGLGNHPAFGYGWQCLEKE